MKKFKWRPILLILFLFTIFLSRTLWFAGKKSPFRSFCDTIFIEKIKDDTLGLHFTLAYPGKLGIETKIKGDILDKGKIALDAKLFSEIVRKLPDSEVSIQTDDAFRALIKCEKAKFNIAGKSGDDFSYLPEIEKNQMVVLSQFSLKEIIRQTIFSIADNENNRLMTGELFEINGNEMKVVSLDGHRISIRKIELKKEYNHIKVVVPGKTLNEVSKILSGGIDDDVCMFFTGRHIVFEFDDTIVVSRLIEGEYFRIEQMLSSDYETKISINKKELQSCIERASLLVKEGDKKPIIMNIMEDAMELKINSFIGSMNEDIDIIKTGRDLMIGFNPKFILDALRVIDDENIDIYMINPKAPCFIRDEEQKYIYLILNLIYQQSHTKLFLYHPKIQL